MKKVLVCFLAGMLLIVSLGLTACGSENKYALTVNGREYLYESLNESYAAGKEVSVKVKIKPYEGVRASLDNEPLVKTKSTQDEYWLFTFFMPSHDATLDIIPFIDFDEPLLYGYYITFNDKNGDKIEKFNKDVKSKDAVAMYAAPYRDENGVRVFALNDGANVFADSKEKVGSDAFELESTLYFTYELLGAVSVVDFVYYDEKTQDVYFYEPSAGFKLDDVGFASVFDAQDLSDTRFDERGAEYIYAFKSNVKLNMKYIDYLTGVKVIECGADNEVIKSADIQKFESEKKYTVSGNCEYVIIEEEYTVKNDEAHNGEKYYERTLINKTEYEGGKLLKYPRGDGLITPAFLSVKWVSQAE